MLRKILNSFQKRGIFGTLIWTIKDPLYLYKRFREKRFDKTYGTDTGEIIQVSEFDDTTPNYEYACWYEGITHDFFNKMIKAIPIAHGDFVFVDLGSGKGKSLMLASRFPFKKIVGVELFQELHEIAKKNIESFVNRKKIPDNFELCWMDAESYNFPENNLVFFLYNPFHGKVMLSVLNKIGEFLKQNPFQVIIFYRNPKCADLFDKQDFLKTVISSPHYRVYTGVNQAFGHYSPVMIGSPV